MIEVKASTRADISVAKEDPKLRGLKVSLITFMCLLGLFGCKRRSQTEGIERARRSNWACGQNGCCKRRSQT
ncbi:MAG: hypothetical protein ACTSUU_08025, partial [Candidatus Thorarchaeota archaeon]